MNNLYKLSGKITKMDEQAVLDAMIRSEEAARTGQTKYEDVVYQSQIDDIKATWSDPLKQYLKAKLAKISQGSVTPGVARRAIEETVIEAILPPRVKDQNHIATVIRNKVTASDVAISALFGIAPWEDVRVPSRKTSIGLVSSRTATPRAPGVLKVKLSEIQEADVYILTHYVPVLKRAWMLGWAKREELALAEQGSRATDAEGCPWKGMSHFIPYEKLRPMGDLVRALSLSQVQPGILFEAPPDPDDLPSDIGDVQQFMTTDDGSGDDFYSILGIEPGKGSMAEPAQEQQGQNENLDF